MSKNMAETEVPQKRHNTAHMRCMMGKRGCMHAQACTCTLARAPTCKHAHTDKYIIFIDFPRQQRLRERAPTLRQSC